MKIHIIFVSILIILSVFIWPSYSAPDDSITVLFRLPKPIGYVNDFAGILEENEKTELSNNITSFEKRTSVEIAVVTIETMSPYPTIEEYAFDLFNSWGIGKKDKNNGVLFLMALKERKIRLEVGLGLEEMLTNEICGSILDVDVIPLFKKELYYEGLRNGVQKVMQILE